MRARVRQTVSLPLRRQRFDKALNHRYRDVTCHLDIMPKRCPTTGGRPRRSTKRQKRGILPLAALIPALVAGGKVVALGAASGAASYGAKKALEAATRKRSNPKRKIPRRAAKQKKRT